MTSGNPGRRPPDWLILVIACVGQFMVVLDVSVVNQALPAIRADLHYSATGLQWVVNAYALTFAGFLLLGGRMADLFGQRRVFVLGVGLFSVASLAGGLSGSATMLTAARAAQGLGGAVLAPATLTVIMTTFTDGAARSRALGAWSAVAGGGGAAGVILGGILTTYLSWRWVLFINVPIGIALGAVALRSLLPGRLPGGGRLDVAGAVTVTAGLAALVYAIVGTDRHAWTSAATLGVLAAAVVLLGTFVFLEARVAPAPLMPLGLFRSRSLSASNVLMLFFGGAFFAMWYFLSLYLQTVRGYSAVRSGMAFLPLSLAVVAGAQLTARLVPRVGARNVLLAGLPISAAGFWWLDQLSASSGYLAGVLGPGILITLGLGICITPIAFAATSEVAPAQAGLASGVVTTSRQMGGSLGLAILATVATARTSALGGATGPAAGAALTGGFDRAFLVAGAFVVGAFVCALALPHRHPAVAEAGAAELAEAAVADS